MTQPYKTKKNIPYSLKKSKKNNRYSQKGGDIDKITAKVLVEQINLFLETGTGESISQDIFDKVKQEDYRKFNEVDTTLLPDGINYSVNMKMPTGISYHEFNQANLSYFNTLKSKKILMCCTHSSLPKEYTPSEMVPDNVCICFQNPIMHLGKSHSKLFFPDPSLESDELFDDIFNYKQNLDDEILEYKLDSDHDIKYGATNYFKHA